MPVKRPICSILKPRRCGNRAGGRKNLRLILAATGAIATGAALSSPLIAGGLNPPIVEPEPIAPLVPSPTLTDWAGFYLGAELTGARGSLGYQTSTPASYRYSDTGSAPGVFVGYDWRWRDRWVFGAELSYDQPNLVYAPLPGFGPILTEKSRIGLSGRVGYLTGNDTLAYGRLGFASTKYEAASGFEGTDSKQLSAVVIGAGIESHVSRAITARIEARYLKGLTSFDTEDAISLKPDELQLAAGVSYRFGAQQTQPLPDLGDFSWTGFYGGLSLGYGPGSLDNAVGSDPYGPYSAGRGVVGVYGGYDWQFAQKWVAGAAIDYTSLNQKFRDPGADTVAASGTTTFAKLESAQAFSLRIGRLLQPETLLYARFGVSSMKMKASSEFYPLDGGGDNTFNGKQLGIGMETALSRHLSLRVEGVYTDTSDEFTTTNAQNQQVRLKPSSMSGQIGLAYRF